MINFSFFFFISDDYDNDIDLIVENEEKVNVIPDEKNDLYFEEEKNKAKKVKKNKKKPADDMDLLYEYYNEVSNKKK